MFLMNNFEKECESGSEVPGKRTRAPTSPKTGALAFISVLPWRINDEG
jgi:hypothetical protein